MLEINIPCLLGLIISFVVGAISGVLWKIIKDAEGK